jgi:hypothetical protein
MIFKVIALFATLIIVPATNAQAVETLLWKTESIFAKEIGPLGECQAEDHECTEADHVGYESVSHYGRTYYLTYEEASRAYVSFDAPLDKDLEHEKQFTFAMGQIAPGAFDWGGIMNGTKFMPLYVIKRFYDPYFNYSTDNPDHTRSGLYVWRLSKVPGEGKSVLIGLAKNNAIARKLAEKDFSNIRKFRK